MDLKTINIEEISKTVKFRNLLAHEYQNLTKEDSLENMSKVIELYPEYIKIIKKELDKKTK